MPSTAIGIERRIGGCRQGRVDAPPLVRRRRAIDRRAQEGMAEGNPRAECEQARVFRRPHRLGSELEPLGRTPQQRRIAERLGRSKEQ
jgi:hypothetical protein